ncbi:MAG: L-serine ammonia-lyase, iron-sulfur-dependent, subunit alpha [Candidatus Kerfeldbacteria bacterium CG15_BIG_FIL_POST_REV_8_21_14_020_45_12]|uniref:L-serine dehydratase n=1 Tax=Candidatus Kerfeldbacteria bacterium CG15_BIG_FIL_POST_REV_8_21_14_020_45_12 TaxID=2014247 RepID=A0A2M7H501_9BACT|nr:MAG: L-serine ammonia-lyase, iron-sulfur-dependent, subunit alpha [Candidatus Kerfeldbacteria bacterium CG15_BIG_FIL_POST_REV_8_21_14_020_45_12]PJA93185.1 MAG: L-serine ammonia-lyase, iron-sulfur-dependent, subunit alpha [Candidatus Kerfeldbacteria bacterium CG_4_9_14_3_um_filter_45_8]
MSYNFTKATQLLALTKDHQVSISEIAIEYEMETKARTREEILKRSKSVLSAMGKAILDAKDERKESVTGLVGGDAYIFNEYLKSPKKKEMFMSDIALHAMVWSMATNETNACSHCIVACPTAGSAGIVPASLYAARDRLKLSEEVMVAGLLNTSAIGLIIEENAMMSGAEGGCQSEDGSAAAMAASGITEMRGGTPEQCLDAAALSLKNVLGLVCDPVGGLVEVPCIKRTTFMVMNAFTASDLAIGGVTSKVPFDEVVDALRRVGEAMPRELRETALGGLATTPTGLRVKAEMAERKNQNDAARKKATG